MYMQLSTGLVQPENGHYNTDNLERIIKALFGIMRVIQRIKDTPPPRTFWQRTWRWIKGIFTNAAALESVLQDLLQIAANAETIRKELQDLDGAELTKIVYLVAQQGEFAAPKKWLTESVPKLLDAIQSFVQTR
jgi:hypothetical protein